MKIEHIALWTPDLERARGFYEKYFAAHAGRLYHNSRTGFRSYFLTFDTGARLELMHRPGIPPHANDPERQAAGLIHFAVSLGSQEAVNGLTNRLRRDGHRIVSEPRLTGDGYYESAVLDPDGNRIEITI